MRLLDQQHAGMPVRAILIAFLALGCLFATAASASAAGSLTLYNNSLQTSEGRDELRQLYKDKCERGGSDSAFRAKVGKRTRECSYRSPVIGRDLSISATARLFKSTPKKVRPQAFVAVNLRQAGDGSRYQLAVFPSGRRFQVKKVLPDGKIEDLAHGKVGNKIKSFSEANRLTLRAYNVLSGPKEGTAKLLAVVNGHKLAVVDDPRGNQLLGRDSGISIGSKKVATGAFGSFVKMLIRMPDPY